MDLPSVFTNIIKRARKPHVCYECKVVIHAGDDYHAMSGCWDGEWHHYKTCIDCECLRDELKYDDELAPLGELRYWAQEAGIDFDKGKG